MGWGLWDPEGKSGVGLCDPKGRASRVFGVQKAEWDVAVGSRGQSGVGSIGSRKPFI